MASNMGINVEGVNDESAAKLTGRSSQSISQLKQEVVNFNSYMVAKTGQQPDQIVDAFTIDLSTIERLLAENGGGDGIRVYMTKETESTNDNSGVTFMVVAVKKTRTDPVPEYVDSLYDNNDNEKGEVYKMMCPTPACPPDIQSSYLLFN